MCISLSISLSLYIYICVYICIYIYIYIYIYMHIYFRPHIANAPTNRASIDAPSRSSVRGPLESVLGPFGLFSLPFFVDRFGLLYPFYD